MNEPPEFDSSVAELEIAENTATNTNIGDPIAASDPESDGLTYSLAGVDAASFNVGPLTGQIKTEGLLDHESPSDVGGDNVYDVNESPEFGSSDVAREVDENTPGGTNIGDPIVASDPESNTLTYSLSGTDSALFSVGVSTGQISVGTGTVLDFESPSDSGGDNVYDLTVKVSDGKDAAGNSDKSIDDMVGVTITVKNHRLHRN